MIQMPALPAAPALPAQPDMAQAASIGAANFSQLLGGMAQESGIFDPHAAVAPVLTDSAAAGEQAPPPAPELPANAPVPVLAALPQPGKILPPGTKAAKPAKGEPDEPKADPTKDPEEPRHAAGAALPEAALTHAAAPALDHARAFQAAASVPPLPAPAAQGPVPVAANVAASLAPAPPPGMVPAEPVPQVPAGKVRMAAAKPLPSPQGEAEALPPQSRQQAQTPGPQFIPAAALVPTVAQSASPARGPRIESAPIETSSAPAEAIMVAPAGNDGPVRNLAAPMPAALAPEARPHDFAALVDRLTQAREAARPGQAALTVAHAEFGPVTLHFRHDESGLSVNLAGRDPDFARAVQAAVPAVAPAPGAPQADPGATGNGGAQARSDAQNFAAGSGSGERQPGHGTERRDERPFAARQQQGDRRHDATEQTPRRGIFA